MALKAYIFRKSNQVDSTTLPIGGIPATTSVMVTTVEDIVAIMQKELCPILIHGFDLTEGTISLIVLDK